MTFVCWQLSFARSHVARVYPTNELFLYSRCISACSTSSFRSLSVCLSLSPAHSLVLSISLCAFWMLCTCDKLCVYADEPQNSTRVPSTHLLVTTSFVSREWGRERASKKWMDQRWKWKEKKQTKTKHRQRVSEWERERKRGLSVMFVVMKEKRSDKNERGEAWWKK